MTDNITRGDVVSLDARTPFLVHSVNTDGSLVLTNDLSPFADPATLDNVNTTRVTVLKRDPIKLDPRVGDTITGATVRAVPWQRGTMLRDRTLGKPADRLVLTGSGKWVNVDADNELRPFEFDEFDVADEFEVVEAPGKARRMVDNKVAAFPFGGYSQTFHLDHVDPDAMRLLFGLPPRPPRPEHGFPIRHVAGIPTV